LWSFVVVFLAVIPLNEYNPGLPLLALFN